MRVKLIGVSDNVRKSESVLRGKRALPWGCGRHLNADSPRVSSMNSLGGQMTLREPTTETSANLEYPACPLCESERRKFPFRLHEPYRAACCMEWGFHFFSPRLLESAMQQAYRESSYYEGGACGYADASYTAQEFALRATFKRLLHNLAKRGLTGGDLLEIGCGYGYLLDEARSFFKRRVGTDFSPEGAEIARPRGAEVFVGGIEQVPSNAKFDCVIGTKLIEHV